jgi:hypothetical protein
METVKVVVRYTDGRVLKGVTQNFFPNKDRFHLFLADKPSGPATEVLIKDLKAVFIVRDFGGNPEYKERKDFGVGGKTVGTKIEVTFQDGEVFVGSTLGYDLKRQGFFVIPADPQSNNLRAFVVSAAIKSVRQLRQP